MPQLTLNKLTLNNTKTVGQNMSNTVSATPPYLFYGSLAWTNLALASTPPISSMGLLDQPRPRVHSTYLFYESLGPTSPSRPLHLDLIYGPHGPTSPSHPLHLEGEEGVAVSLPADDGADTTASTSVVCTSRWGGPTRGREGTTRYQHRWKVSRAPLEEETDVFEKMRGLGLTRRW